MPGIESGADLSFVRTAMEEEALPPATSRGVIGWLRENLFSSWSNTLLTLIAMLIIWEVLPPLVNFALIDAVWSGENREACTTGVQGGVQPDGWFGACWPYVGDYFAQFIYGRYPFEARWRVDLVFILFAIGIVPMLIPTAPFKRENIGYMAVVFPIATLILLTGGRFYYSDFLGLTDILLSMKDPESALETPTLDAAIAFLQSDVTLGSLLRFNVGFLLDFVLVAAVVLLLAYGWARATGESVRTMARSAAIAIGVLALLLIVLATNFGLQPVETDVWGGLLVTLVIAVSGIAASLPLGILLALGRRSSMPIVRAVCIAFIEFWRGVPLISVLFMSSVMLPLFLPEGVSFDKLLRALIGVALFSAAYMAEVVRGGLQAIQKGQYEGADAVGLTYWQKTRLIVLPQALTLVIPGIVNTFIGLFKDTTLVLIIGLFDFLGQIQSSFTDPTWASPVQATSAYFFAALVYWVFCFSMSRYSIYTEHRLSTSHKR